MNQDTIMRYVRGKDGRKVGMLVGKLQPDGVVSIGWSRCRAGDVFNREEGFMVAEANMGMLVPSSLLKAAKSFRVQCFIDFKTATHIRRVEAMSSERKGDSQLVQMQGRRFRVPVVPLMENEIREKINKNLHRSLSRLCSDFVLDNPEKMLGETTVLQLMEWSRIRTQVVV